MKRLGSILAERGETNEAREIPQVLSVLRNVVVIRYYESLFKAKPFHESLVRIGNGILAHRMRIPMELLKCELFPKPPEDEQAAIVRFLDHANRRLEKAMASKRRLIGLLNEQKQVI